MRSNVLIICGTAIIALAICSATLLVLTGHDSELRVVALLLAPYLSGLLTLAGVELKGRRNDRVTEAAKEEIVHAVVNGAAHSGDSSP